MLLEARLDRPNPSWELPEKIRETHEFRCYRELEIRDATEGDPETELGCSVTAVCHKGTPALTEVPRQTLDAPTGGSHRGVWSWRYSGTR